MGHYRKCRLNVSILLLHNNIIPKHERTDLIRNLRNIGQLVFNFGMT